MYKEKGELVGIEPTIPNKICPNCHKSFVPVKKNVQKYCSRTCFKQLYNQSRRTKSKDPSAEDLSRPTLICDKCNHRTILSFSPRGWSGYQLLKEFICPNCGEKKGE